MDKEIIGLLKTLAGSAETLVIWYMVLDFAKHVISWAGAVACAWAIARSATTGWAWLTGQDMKK